MCLAAVLVVFQALNHGRSQFHDVDHYSPWTVTELAAPLAFFASQDPHFRLLGLDVEVTHLRHVASHCHHDSATAFSLRVFFVPRGSNFQLLVAKEQWSVLIDRHHRLTCCCPDAGPGQFLVAAEFFVSRSSGSRLLAFCALPE